LVAPPLHRPCPLWNLIALIATFYLTSVLFVLIVLGTIARFAGFSTSKGASGVTGAGFITLAATLSVVPDIPIQSIAILVGIDKFMSECRALTNLIGNGVACVVISRSEGELDKDKLHETMAHPIQLGEALEPGR
jgi:aerobic C4-dicarboxylate transport protein